MVIPRHRQNTALRPGSGEIRVPERIARAVHAGRLAVPHAKYAVITRAGQKINLLSAPDRRGAKILVDRLAEYDLSCLKEILGGMRLLVQPAQRRTTIARDETRSFQPGCRIAAGLVQQHPQQGLNAGDENPAFLKRVFIVDPDLIQRHFSVSPITLI